MSVELPDFIFIKNPCSDSELIKKLNNVRKKAGGLMLDFTNNKADSDKYYETMRAIMDEFDESIVQLNCRNGYASLNGRRVIVEKVNKDFEGVCSDCGDKAYYLIIEENSKKWLYCGDCAIG